jgi:predicted choloylglycine hydrolase
MEGNVRLSKLNLKLFFVGIMLLLTLTDCKVFKAYQDILSMREEGTRLGVKGEPRIEYVNSIPIIHVYGEPYEMGYQYGKLLKKQLFSLTELTADLFSKRKIRKYMEIGREAGGNLPDKMVSELKGMSDASGVDYDMLLALNLVPRVNCSVLAMWGEATADGELIMGRNADYYFKTVNKALGLIVVKHPSEGYATISATFLGLLGSFNGMNETGLSYGNMLSYNGTDKNINTKGLSIQLLMQLGAEQSATAREMAEFITAQKHMINNNVMSADKNEAFIAEIGPSGSFLQEGKRGVLAATNYFQSPSMYDEYTPCERFGKLMFFAKEKHGNFESEDMKEAMQIATRKGNNLQCILFEPGKKKIHVSINKVPASQGPFTEFDITEFLK